MVARVTLHNMRRASTCLRGQVEGVTQKCRANVNYTEAMIKDVLYMQRHIEIQMDLLGDKN